MMLYLDYRFLIIQLLLVKFVWILNDGKCCAIKWHIGFQFFRYTCLCLNILFFRCTKKYFLKNMYKDKGRTLIWSKWTNPRSEEIITKAICLVLWYVIRWGRLETKNERMNCINLKNDLSFISWSIAMKAFIIFHGWIISVDVITFWLLATSH